MSSGWPILSTPDPETQQTVRHDIVATVEERPERDERTTEASGGPLVSRWLVRALIEAGDAYGLRATQLYDLVGLRRDLGAPETEYLPVSVEEQLWKELHSRANDPGLGLHAAQRLNAGAFGLIEYAATSAPDLGRSLELLATFGYVLHGFPIFELQKHEDRTRLIYNCPHPIREAWARASEEFALAAVCELGRRSTGETWKPERVMMRQPPPEHASEVEAYFGCPVEYLAEAAGFWIGPSSLALNNHAADVRLSEVLITCLGRESRDVQLGSQLAQRVSQLLRDLLSRGEAVLPVVANRLSMSPRTLQHRLSREGRTFRELLDEVREAEARRLLSDPQVGVAEVAAALAYSEPSAFHRAFRRWTGMSPESYRKRRLGVEPQHH